MTETTAPVVETVTEAVETAVVTTTPKSVVQRASRKRFSFGPVWNQAVVDGTATDFDKLLAQGLSLRVGANSDLRKLKLGTLRAKVAAKLEADLLAQLEASDTPTAEATV